jgi:hypothetical protein
MDFFLNLNVLVANFICHQGTKAQRMNKISLLMVFTRSGFQRKLRVVICNYLIIILLIMIFSAGCATSYKHKRLKEIPCPCEIENRR